MNLFEPFFIDFLGIGIGARLDITTVHHVVLYSGVSWIWFVFLRWRMFGETRLARTVWFWTVVLVVLAVEFEQGRDFVVPCEPRSFFDLIEATLPNILNFGMIKFIFKERI